MVISLVIAEAALETVPVQIIDHPSVRNYAQRMGRPPDQTLLDRSYHHSAMVHANLKSQWKRGRPDIVHFALMEALSTPLFMRRKVNVYLHTINDRLISIGENLHIPKSYFRFEALMTDLFKKKVIRPFNDDNGYGYDGVNNSSNKKDRKKNILLQLHEDMTFEKVIKNMVKPSKLIGLSTVGIQSTTQSVVAENISGESTNCAFVIGGFAKGHFSNNITALLNRLYSIAEYRLEAHVVIARILYECEKILHI
jgi:rRNA small subunit pseudouridine methyltransferase Nep1